MPPLPETVSHQKLRSRIQYLRTHLEIADSCLRLGVHHLSLPPDKSQQITQALPFNCDRYQHLNHPLTEVDRLFNHSRAKNAEYAIIATYTHFAEYLHGVLGEMYVHNPLLVVGKAVGNHTLSFPDIVKHGTYDAIAQHMVGQVFRSLENERSTRKLLEKILRDTDAQIDDNARDDALAYLEMRHVFIHRSGIADDVFVAAYGEKFALVVGDKLPTDFTTASAAIDSAETLCRSIDSELIRNAFVKDRNE